MSFKFKTLIKKQPELKVCGVVTGGNGFDVCPPCSLEDERRKETDTGTQGHRPADGELTATRQSTKADRVQRRPSTGAPQPKALFLATPLKANSAVSEPESSNNTRKNRALKKCQRQ